MTRRPDEYDQALQHVDDVGDDDDDDETDIGDDEDT